MVFTFRWLHKKIGMQTDWRLLLVHAANVLASKKMIDRFSVFNRNELIAIVSKELPHRGA
jgi:hypothetical protein